MRMRTLRGLICLLLLSGLGAAGEVAGQTYFFAVSGVPSTITCTPTSSFIGGTGLDISWNLPMPGTVRSVLTVGGVVVYDQVQAPLGPSGTFENFRQTTTWTTPTPLPYTWSILITPVYTGAGTTTFGYDCVDGVGINFRISNAPPFGPSVTAAPIPTLAQWALIALATILAVLSLQVLKASSATSCATSDGGTGVR